MNDSAIPSPTRSLDYVALGTIAMGVALIASISNPPCLWLMAAAALAGIYGWATSQRDLVVTAILTPLVYVTGTIAAYMISFMTPRTIDDALARMDHGAGIAAWHWCLLHPACYLLLKPVYLGLGVMIIAGITFSDRRAPLIRAILISSVAGLISYFLFPAVGPAWIGRPHAMRNCMPSLHLTYALLLWIYSSKALRFPMLLFAALTAMSTVGLGEHYMVDLVAALPFTAAVCMAARKPFPSLLHIGARTSRAHVVSRTINSDVF